jgi:Aromatic ring hydroxylase
MTFESPDTGRRVSKIWQLPTSYAELVERRGALEAWTELHYGFMGRSPDHVASCISGMYMGIDVFEQYDPARAGALRDYYKYARDNDLFLTYVIVNPQANQAKAAHEQEDKYLAVGIVDQDARVSPCVAQRCSPPAASWRTRCSAVVSSPCARATRCMRCLSPYR